MVPQHRKLKMVGDLLTSMFNVDELRRFVAALGLHDGAVWLPEGPVSLEQLAHAVAEGLHRRGAMTSSFFDVLERDRPERRRDIAKVAPVILGQPPETSVEQGVDGLRRHFDVSDRVLPLATEAARMLRESSGGLPALASEVLGDWEARGCARRLPDGRFLVTPRDLAALRLGLLSSRRSDRLEPAPPRDPDLRTLLDWIVLCQPRAWLPVIAHARGSEVERELTLGEALVAHGWVHAMPGRGDVVLCGPRRALSRPWSDAEWEAAHRGLAQAWEERGALSSSDPGQRLAWLCHARAGRVIAGMDRVALDVARHFAEAGHLPEALEVLTMSLRALEGSVSAAVVKPLVEEMADLAFSDPSPQGLKDVLEILDRVAEPGAVAPLRALLRSAHAALLRDVREARALMPQTGDLDNPVLAMNRWMLSLRVLEAPSRDARDALLAQAEAWSNELPDHRRVAIWDRMLRLRARVHYLNGEYACAGAFYYSASSCSARRDHAVQSLLSAASAWLEAGEHHQAAEHARRALASGRELGHAWLAMHAEYILSVADYRLMRWRGPDLERVDAVRAWRLPMLAEVALQEAAFAWRAGDLESGLALASEAEMLYAAQSRPIHALLCRSLAVTCGATLRVDDLARALSCCAHPCGSLEVELAVQALGLLGHASSTLSLVAQAQELATLVPANRHAHVLDILSIAEAVNPREPEATTRTTLVQGAAT